MDFPVSLIADESFRMTESLALEAAVTTLADGSEVLELSAAVIQITSIALVPDVLHLSEKDPVDSVRGRPLQGAEECLVCASCPGRHVYACNKLGHICGLLLFDCNQISPGPLPHEFEAILLLKDTVRSAKSKTETSIIRNAKGLR